jgi:CRISPR-associated endonuclease/helicase Cas3
MKYFAHSLPNADPVDWQPLRDHLESVQRIAGERAAKFRAGGPAALSGLLHDLGKYSAGFQRRLHGGDPVDHSTAGAREIRELAGSDGGARLIAQIVAHCIAGHHAGLPDSIGDLDRRLDEKELEPLDPIWRDEIGPDPAKLAPPAFEWHKAAEAWFQFGFLGRMIFSCLIDADFRDTESFFAAAEGREVDRDWKRLPDIVDQLTARLDSHFARLRTDAPDTSVNRLRAEILTHVRAQAEKPRGAFSLNVPTGGGKTLASLAFALDHARRHGLERIVYAIPFTSVIDQTATIFKDILGEDVVLEHHSSIDEDGIGGREARDKLRLAMEDWAAPNFSRRQSIHLDEDREATVMFGGQRDHSQSARSIHA